MIKINLLEAYKQGAGAFGILSEDDERRKIYLDALKRAVILFIGPLAFYAYENKIIPELQTQLNEINLKYDEAKNFNDSKQNLTEEIRKYEEAQARFNAQMDFINQIDHDKVNEYRLFELLKTSTPAAVWINRLELQENSITINVESTESKEIEEFIRRLTNSDFIVNLVPITQVTKSNFLGTEISTTTFTVKGNLVSKALR